MNKRTVVIRSKYAMVVNIVACVGLLGYAAFLFGREPWMLAVALVVLLWSFYSLDWPLEAILADGRLRLKSPLRNSFDAPTSDIRRVTLNVEQRSYGKGDYRCYPVVIETDARNHEVQAPTDYLEARRLSETLGILAGAEVLDGGLGEATVRQPGALNQRWIDTIRRQDLGPAPSRLHVRTTFRGMAIGLPPQHGFYWLLGFGVAGGAGYGAHVLSNGSVLFTAVTAAVLVSLTFMTLAGPTVVVGFDSLAIRYPMGLKEHVDLDDLAEIRLDPQYGGLLLVGDFSIVRLWSPLEDHEVDWLRQAIAQTVAKG